MNLAPSLVLIIFVINHNNFKLNDKILKNGVQLPKEFNRPSQEYK